ncbi:MAG: hypothetical protein BWY04_01565 [candidate division CPR1 bacterium ADurb.Bin160]|uniref:Uncharacterized protein n=1 Tax=candidate division CPR1 bacterium ADurb.Bin160 TaxID=1852826 RepID=A0A1V5ZH61_9BACT|nr:MAG: hypothetical protein BWY04_01565 [candidate division CPR1 bacterium ADurb.Bin160]
MKIKELLNQEPVPIDEYIDIQIDHIFQEAEKRNGELTKKETLELVNKIKKSAEYYLDYEEEDEEALQKEAELKGAEIWNNER